MSGRRGTFFRPLFLALSLQGCAPREWDIEARDVLIATFTPEGRFDSAHTFHEGDRVELDLPEGATAVAFDLDPDAFLWFDRKGPVDFTVVARDAPPPGSCGRCVAPTDSSPLVLTPGELCPIPPWMSARSVYDDEGVTSPDPPLLDRIRNQLALAIPGSCHRPSATIEPQTGVAVSFDWCPVLPEDAPLFFTTAGLTTQGTFVGVTPDYIHIVTPDGISETISGPPGESTGITALPGGDMIWIAQRDDTSEDFARLHVRERRVELLSTDLQRATLAKPLSTGETLYLGSDDGIAGSRCSPNGDCHRIPFPRQSDPECGFLANPTEIEDVLEIPGGILYVHRRVAGFLLERPGEPIRCLSAAVADDPDIDELGPVARLGTLLLFGAQTFESSPRIVTGLLESDGTIGGLHTLTQISAHVDAIVPGPNGTLRALTRSAILDIDASGALISRSPTDQWGSGMEGFATRASTSSTGWELVENSRGVWFSRAPGADFTPVYGSTDSTFAGLTALGSTRGTCLAAIAGSVLEVSSTGSSCTDLNIRRTPAPDLIAPFAGMSVEEGVLWLVASQPKWSLHGSLGGLASRALAELDVPTNDKLVTALSFTPTSGLLVFSSGLVLEVEQSGERGRLKLPFSPLSASAIDGVAWVGGEDELVRVRVTAEGITSDSWSSVLTSLPSDVPVSRHLYATHAVAGDRVFFSLAEKSRRLERLFEYGVLLQVRSKAGLPILEVAPNPAPSFLFSPGRYRFTGHGPRMTWSVGDRAFRTGVSGRATAFAFQSLEDCGEFMLAGGPSQHATALVDQ